MQSVDEFEINIFCLSSAISPQTRVSEMKIIGIGNMILDIIIAIIAIVTVTTSVGVMWTVKVCGLTLVHKMTQRIRLQ